MRREHAASRRPAPVAFTSISLHKIEKATKQQQHNFFLSFTTPAHSINPINMMRSVDEINKDAGASMTEALLGGAPGSPAASTTNSSSGRRNKLISRRLSQNRNGEHHVGTAAAPRSTWGSIFTTLRFKMLLVGFFVGYLTEVLFVKNAREGHVNFFDDTTHAKVVMVMARSEDEKTTSHPLVIQARASDRISVHIESWSDLIFYEMSYLFVDVFFLVYVIILARAVVRGGSSGESSNNSPPLNIQLAIQAANWLLGMVLGLGGSLCLTFGTHAFLSNKVWSFLGCMVIGVLLCFMMYFLAGEIEKVFYPDRFTCDGEERRERQERPRGDEAMEDEDHDDGPASYAAHIV